MLGDEAVVPEPGGGPARVGEVRGSRPPAACVLAAALSTVEPGIEALDDTLALALDDTVALDEAAAASAYERSPPALNSKSSLHASAALRRNRLEHSAPPSTSPLNERERRLLQLARSCCTAERAALATRSN